MYSDAEISRIAREHLHSKLIRDTGIIFLELKKYDRHGYLRHEDSKDSSYIDRLSLAASAVLSTMAFSVLLTTSSPERIQKSDSAEQAPIVFMPPRGST